MTIYYLDPENGDDTKNGLSFANRWKTLRNCQTTPAVDGDEFRMIASKDHYSLGSSLWVDNTEFVELDVANIRNITSEGTGWIAHNNTDVNTSERDLTSSTCNLGPVTMFYNTKDNYNGRLAYKTLAAPLDLSAWTHMSFLLSTGDSWPIDLTVKLCSDALGTVPVASFDLAGVRSYKFPALVTSGGPLPAQVRSIAIHTKGVLLRSFTLFAVENFIACTGPGAADHLSHGVIISKMSEAEPEWLPVRGIVGKKIYIGPSRRTGANAPYFRTWRGTGGPATCFALQPIKLRWLNRYDNKLNAYDLSVSFTGGWDRGDMATRTGVTWLHGENQRMLNGGDSSSNPDLPSSGADDYNMMLRRENSGIDTEIQKVFKLHGFGFTDFVEFPVEHNSYDKRDFDLEGLVGVAAGLPHIGNNPTIKIKYVSWCWWGVFTIQNRRQWTAIYEKSNYLIDIGKITGVFASSEAWLPSADFDDTTSMLRIGAIENTMYGVANGFSTTQDPSKSYSRGIFRLWGTKFRYIGAVDATLNNEAVFTDCHFLKDDGTPGREPTIYPSGSLGASAMSRRTDGKGWDTRVWRTNKYNYRVRNTGGRSPGKNVLELQCTPDAFARRVIPPARAQIALVAARAGQVTTVAAYISQDMRRAPDPENNYPGQKVCICTLPGMTPGVGRVEGVCLGRPRQYNKVVIAFTSDVDALVPIYLEGTNGVAKATEVGMAPEGTEPEGDPGPAPTPVPIVTDSITIQGAYELVAGVYAGHSAGTEESNSFMATKDIPMSSFTSGTVFERTPFVDGAGLLDTGEGYVLLMILRPGWMDAGVSTDDPMKLWFPAILDADGVEVWRYEPYAANGYEGAGAYADWAMGQWSVPYNPLIDPAAKLTFQIYRVDREVT